MRKSLLWIILLFVLIIVALIYRPGKEDRSSNTLLGSESPKSTDTTDDILDNTGSAVSEPITYPTGYAPYDATSAELATNDGKKVALFFYSADSIRCQSLEKNILENAELIEPDTLIYKIDFSTAEDLKQQYHITSEHTIVYLDENMQAKKIAKGIPTLNDLLANF